MAGREQAIATPHEHQSHRVRIRRRKKFWQRPSWWSLVGKSIIVIMLAASVLFCMYLVWAGLSPQ